DFPLRHNAVRKKRTASPMLLFHLCSSPHPFRTLQNERDVINLNYSFLR
ncbi:hypothetical protein D043_4157B, partial [Vibrio parahaemolyticus EKP-021]